MSGDSSTKTTDATQKSDPWDPAQPYLKQALGAAGDAFANTYNGSSVAGMDPNITAGQNIALRNAYGGQLGQVGQNAINNVGNTLQNGGLTGAQSNAMQGIGNSLDQFNGQMNQNQNYLNPYASGQYLHAGQNPYLDSTINASMQQAGDAVNRQFSGAGRYGSGANTQVLGTQLGNIATNARMQDYNTQQQNQLAAIGQSSSMANAGLNGNMAGQGAMASLGQQGFNNNLAAANNAGALNNARNIDATTMSQIGGQNMDYRQRVIDAGNQDPWTKVGNLAQVAGGIGSMGGTRVGHEVSTTEGHDGTLTTIGKGVKIGSDLAGMWKGSDERMKENIAPVGKLNDGQQIYAYNYKGDDQPQIGLMAQEVEKKVPEAVATGADGLKRVNYALATAYARKKGKS